MSIKSFKQYLERLDAYYNQRDEWEKQVRNGDDPEMESSFGFRTTMRRVDLKLLGKKLSFARLLNFLLLKRTSKVLSGAIKIAISIMNNSSKQID